MGKLISKGLEFVLVGTLLLAGSNLASAQFTDNSHPYFPIIIENSTDPGNLKEKKLTKEEEEKQQKFGLIYGITMTMLIGSYLGYEYIRSIRQKKKNS